MNKHSENLKVRIGDILIGDGDVALEKEIEVAPYQIPGLDNCAIFSPIKIKSAIHRIDRNAAMVIIRVSYDLETGCSRCLTNINIPIDFKAEGVFSVHPDLDEGEFSINKFAEIDLTRFLEEEIVLHIPTSSLCSKGCKGICNQCGKNLNKEKCRCKKS